MHYGEAVLFEYFSPRHKQFRKTPRKGDCTLPKLRRSWRRFTKRTSACSYSTLNVVHTSRVGRSSKTWSDVDTAFLRCCIRGNCNMVRSHGIKKLQAPELRLTLGLELRMRVRWNLVRGAGRFLPAENQAKNWGSLARDSAPEAADLQQRTLAMESSGTTTEDKRPIFSWIDVGKEIEDVARHQGTLALPGDSVMTEEHWVTPTGDKQTIESTTRRLCTKLGFWFPDRVAD